MFSGEHITEVVRREAVSETLTTGLVLGPVSRRQGGRLDPSQTKRRTRSGRSLTMRLGLNMCAARLSDRKENGYE